MVASVAHSAGSASVVVLLAPRLVPIVDIFRALGDFEDRYDLAALDALEDHLAETMIRDAAKGIVSDALLLAFGMRRERREPLDHAPCGSRRATDDELHLLSLLGAARARDFTAASEAAAALGLRQAQPLISLALDIARRFEAAGIDLDAPDPGLHRAGHPVRVEVERAAPVALAALGRGER